MENIIYMYILINQLYIIQKKEYNTEKHQTDNMSGGRPAACKQTRVFRRTPIYCNKNNNYFA